MNSLVSYGSDDNSEASSDERTPEMPGRQTTSAKNYRKPGAHEDNYEEVGMDMSEDSDDSSGPKREEPQSKPVPKKSDSSPPGARQRDNKSGSRSPKSQKEDDRRSDSYRSEDRYKRRSDRDSRDENKAKEKDRHRDRRDDRYSRDRRDRDRRRSRSRERRRSRSPKTPKRPSRSPRRHSRSPRRSRSGSRDRGTKSYSSRRERANNRMDRLDKLGIEFKPDTYPASAIEEAEQANKKGGDRFFIPGITGRFRDQIEKRKQLWQKAKEPETSSVSTTSRMAVVAAGGSNSTKVYEATSFADDKTSNKFKRLMGIKESDKAALPVTTNDVLKKQQEMFTSMEAQYEVARTATHTMRGVGLGFGSFQR